MYNNNQKLSNYSQSIIKLCSRLHVSSHECGAVHCHLCPFIALYGHIHHTFIKAPFLLYE
jgi:hypothetical protein